MGYRGEKVETDNEFVLMFAAIFYVGSDLGHRQRLLEADRWIMETGVILYLSFCLSLADNFI